jgi:anion-transporting  ArsA/GET3 family ATPase
MIPSKKIELFCGTGGVGKTTLATSRAYSLAMSGKKVLLITIDPARRLKQILGIKDDNAGEVSTLTGEDFQFENGQLDALLMNPKTTLKRMAKLSQEGSSLDNPIVNILTKPYGGMNEIMAIIEVQHHLKTGGYDTIILDTPPGKHFIDFLQSSQKINQFFDKSFVDIFKYFGKRFSKSKEEQKSGFLSLIVKSGIKKLLSYLEKVTGESFVDEFIDAISGLYLNRSSFTEALVFQEDLKKADYSNWFLVTSVDQRKAHEATDLQQNAENFMHKDSFLVVNRSLTPYLENWHPDASHKGLVHLHSSMKARENTIKDMGAKRLNQYKEVLYFPEVLDIEPMTHVKNLASSWK